MAIKNWSHLATYLFFEKSKPDLHETSLSLPLNKVIFCQTKPSKYGCEQPPSHPVVLAAQYQLTGILLFVTVQGSFWHGNLEPAIALKSVSYKRFASFFLLLYPVVVNFSSLTCIFSIMQKKRYT